MATQAQGITRQTQATTTQVNRKVKPYVNPNAITMASRLTDFTRMNPLMFFGSNVNVDTQDILDEVYKILFPRG